jgi:hypothetical protein
MAEEISNNYKLSWHDIHRRVSHSIDCHESSQLENLSLCTWERWKSTLYIDTNDLVLVVNIQIKRLSLKSLRSTLDDRHQLKRRWLIEKRVTQTILLVIGKTISLFYSCSLHWYVIQVTFLTCWLPYSIMIFIGGFINPNWISPVLTTSLSLLTKTSFVSNAFIYVMRNRSLRSSFFAESHQQTHRIQVLPSENNPSSTLVQQSTSYFR